MKYTKIPIEIGSKCPIKERKRMGNAKIVPIQNTTKTMNMTGLEPWIASLDAS